MMSRGSGHETSRPTNGVLLLLLLLEEVHDARHEDRCADEDDDCQKDHDSAKDSLQRLLHTSLLFLAVSRL